jgi:hypothetical protein
MTRYSSKSEEPLMSAIAEKLPKTMPAVMCYSVSREKRLYWENVVPGVREAVKRGDYIKVFNLIGESPQFKQMRSAQEKKWRPPGSTSLKP